MLPAVEMWSPNHGAAREVPTLSFERDLGDHLVTHTQFTDEETVEAV